MNTLERYESVSRNYLRSAPVVFDRARGSKLFDEQGNSYIDFSSAGGSATFGHNNPGVRDALAKYLGEGRVFQTCDKASVSKRHFIEQFARVVLERRKLNYRILFTDPAGGTAAELAFRLARPYRNRTNILAFTNANHGLTEGSLSATGRDRQLGAGLRANTVYMPYCGYFGENTDTIAYLRRY